MVLFESLVNHESFRKKPIILFLNKIDRFVDKLASSPISDHFPDYTGFSTDVDAVTMYFTDQFRQTNRTRKREIYGHCLNATDTSSVRLAIDHLLNNIYLEQLRAAGLKASVPPSTG
jgi:hypothetical protein